MHKLRQITTALSLAIAAACKESTITTPTGEYSVRVFNGSPVAVSNVRVQVSDRDEFTVSRLDHGDMSERYTVSSLHTNPAVALLVDGATLAAIPIEGFSGFNPALPPGAYVIIVSVVNDGSSRRLDVSVQQPVEDNR